MTVAEIEDAILERSSSGKPLGPTLTGEAIRALRRARGADEQSGRSNGPVTYDFDPRTATKAFNAFEAATLAAAWANGERETRLRFAAELEEIRKWSALAQAFAAVQR